MSRAFQEFSQVARAEKEQEVKPMVPVISAPVQQVSRVFTFQSYFDSTLLEKAILAQRPNDPIVASTKLEEQIPGYGIALHPSSQTPVAVQFKVGAGLPSSSQPVVLRPGQVLRPHGLRGREAGAFSGFSWGLPFGWLGGGLATLLVLQTPDAEVQWSSDHNEVIFHRIRMKILAAADIPSAAPKNWPMRFPWTQALASATANVQKGSASIGLVPTKVLMRLRAATLAGAADMRILVHESNEFDLDSAGAVIATPVGFMDATWGAFAGTGGATNLSTQYPIRGMPEEIVWLAADDGGISLIDASSGDLAGLYVDIVRYGRL